MYRALIALAVVAAAQDYVPIPPLSFDRELVLDLSTDDPILIEGSGPTEIVEYVSRFEGLLHVRTDSDLKLSLRARLPNGGQLLSVDEYLEDGDSSYLLLYIKPGDRLSILISGEPKATGPFVLHLVATPETDATSEASEKAFQLSERLVRVLENESYPRARKMVSRAVELLNVEGAEYSQELIDGMWEIGFQAYDAGSIDDCFTIWKRAWQFCQRTVPNHHPSALVAGTNLAISLSELGDIAGARVLEEIVLAGYEQAYPPDDFELLAARSNLAVSVAEMGDVAAARALEESVLAGFERTLHPYHPEILAARSNLAVSMAEMGDLAGARALEESVLAGFELTLPADDPEILSARLNLAVSLEEMGDFQGALSLQESVLKVYEHSLPRDHFDVIFARAELANSMHRSGKLAEARSLRQSVLAAYERTVPPEHIDLISAKEALAESMHKMGDYEEARILRESALEVYKGRLSPDHPDLLAGRVNLAISLEVTGDSLGARAQVAPLCSGMRARVLDALALAPRQAREAIGSEGFRLEAALYFSEAEGQENQSLVFELMETMRLVAGEAARSLSQFDEDPELVPIFRRAADVRRTLNDLVAGSTPEDRDEELVSAELTRLSLERDQLEREATRVLSARGVVTNPVEVPALAAALDGDAALVGYRRISRWYLDETTGALEVGADHLFAHVLRHDGVLSRLDLGPAAELEELAIAWRSSLGAPLLRSFAPYDSNQSQEIQTGVRLREQILDPILAELDKETRRIFVCADDLIFLLPLDALPLDVDGAERLGDRMQVINEVSFAHLTRQESGPMGEPSLLALGGVDYDAKGAAPDGIFVSSAPITDEDSAVDDGGEPIAEDSAGDTELIPASTTRSAFPENFQKLLQGGYEAEATADLFEEAFEVEPTLLMRKRATKQALFDAAPGKRYLHMATHGWFAPESVRSTRDVDTNGRNGFSRMGLDERVSGLAPMTLCGLALTGANRGRDSFGRVAGILTAEELCLLDLSQCELAVLSACETNVGIRRAGQGIQSLQAALYAAGVRTSITSLWKVDDAATRRLMEHFYTNLWHTKLPKAEALWRAKVALRDDGHAPSDWAGWVMTGDPD